jgi:hypothetical protein
MKYHHKVNLRIQILKPLCIIILFVYLSQIAFAQNKGKPLRLLSYSDTLLLESKMDTTANVSIADFDGDGHLDILLVKGRHWPIVDNVLLGNGKGGIKKEYALSKIADRSYTGAVADFNGDKFPDIAVSNDDPDKKYVYLNDGKGNFTLASEFGLAEWSTRNIAIADINKDKLPDIILANRGDLGKTSNYICFNKGKGKFDTGFIAFAPYPATTIYPADINKDGYIDLVVPNRDSGQSYIYLGGSDYKFPESRRIPFGPPDATIRVAAAADFNGDKWMDIVTADEFKGVHLYLGKKDGTFSDAISLAGKEPRPYALSIADLNKDGRMDIIVGHISAPSTIYFNKGRGKDFTPVNFGDAAGTVYGFAFGDFNEDGIPDIAAARSDATNMLYFGQRVKASRQK